MIDRDFIVSVHALCVQAGKATIPHFGTNEVTHKQDGSPFTVADIASEAIIIAGLTALTPDIPIIAEEQAEADLLPNITAQEKYWLVDPLDGTREFTKGNPDFCINIALIKNGTPIFGAVYRPVTGDFYHGGTATGGAFFNRKPIKTRNLDDQKGFILVTAYGLKIPQKVQNFMQDHKIAHTVTCGATLKFCLVAKGDADIYPRFTPSYEWDTAAAHALLLAAGGDIWDMDTQSRLGYGKNNYRNGSIIVGTNQALRIVCQ